MLKVMTVEEFWRKKLTEKTSLLNDLKKMGLVDEFILQDGKLYAVKKGEIKEWTTACDGCGRKINGEKEKIAYYQSFEMEGTFCIDCIEKAYKELKDGI